MFTKSPTLLILPHYQLSQHNKTRTGHYANFHLHHILIKHMHEPTLP